MPAFWFFVCTCTYNTKLFIVVWKSQLTMQQLYDEQFMRRRLTGVYVALYSLWFTITLFQNWFLYDPFMLIMLNSSLWFPQVLKNFKHRSRKGPSTKLAVSMLIAQCFYPLYIKMCPKNFLEIEPDYKTGLIMIACMALQIFLLVT